MALACGQKRPHLFQAELCRQTSRRFLAADASQKSLAGCDLEKAGLGGSCSYRLDIRPFCDCWHARLANFTKFAGNDSARPAVQQAVKDGLTLLMLFSGDGCSSSGVPGVKLYAPLLLSNSLTLASSTPRHTKCIILADTDGSVDWSNGERAASKGSYVYPTQGVLRSFERSSAGSFCQ